jgi:hypothetical protein
MRILRTILVLLLLALAAPPLAQATVSNSVSSVTIAGNAAQTVFPFNFIAVAPNDIAVIFTDAAGNQTTIAQGQYTLSLNAALPGNIWGIGGSVTYPLVGSPIANGTTLTIARTVPNTQTVSSNQGQAFPTAVESGLDLLAMQIQQLSVTGKVLQSSPADTCSSLGFLPNAVQRANQILGFDGTGCNPVAVSTLPAGAVSSAMQPVVNAASLAAGRTALGLGAMATLTPNFGLQQNVTGAGNVDVNYTIVDDATGQSVTSGFHLTQRFASGAVTYTLPLASTLWNGFGFWVTALTNPVTFAPNAADNFLGMPTATAFIIPAGTSVFITTGAGSTWRVTGLQRIGLNSPLNMQISATVASNKLTIAVKDLNGNDPSTTSPVFVGFRSQTLTSGNTIVGTITAPLSFTLNAASSMGCTTAVACRLWGELICQTESSGACTAVLVGLSVQSTSTACYPLSESNLQATGSGTGGGTTINTIQTSVSALSTKAIRIAFFVEATWVNSVGWSTNPTIVQVFGPGIARPCQQLQEITGTTSSATSCSANNTQTSLSAAITPSSTVNLIDADADWGANSGTTGTLTQYFRMSRGATPTYFGTEGPFTFTLSGGITMNANIGGHLLGLDSPATTSSTTYYVYCVNNGSANFNGLTQPLYMKLREIMGALEPANDNIKLKEYVG